MPPASGYLLFKIDFPAHYTIPNEIISRLFTEDFHVSRPQYSRKKSSHYAQAQNGREESSRHQDTQSGRP
jgi:hypothetical protein